jgi:hypothetical protein
MEAWTEVNLVTVRVQDEDALELVEQRHVHLFTNQLLGSWDAEIEQCLRHALGYLRLAGTGSRRAKKLLRELKEFS